jgi:hypothetical protein
LNESTNATRDHEHPTPRDNASAPADQIPTKDLYERFARLRDSTRYAGFYLIAAAGLLLGWSRSPSWNFKIPFELFTQPDGKALSVPCGYAPVFGPIILVFFYVRLFMLHRDTQCTRAVLAPRLSDSVSERTLLEPPFQLNKTALAESFLFVGLLCVGTSILTVMLLGDYLNLKVDGRPLWESLYTLGAFYGDRPTHNSNPTNLTVFGFPQTWLYVLFTLFDLYLLAEILAYTWSYNVEQSGTAIGHTGEKRRPSRKNQR